MLAKGAALASSKGSPGKSKGSKPRTKAKPRTKTKPRRKPPAKAGKPWNWRTPLRRLAISAGVALLALALGAGIVLAVLIRDAEKQVTARLEADLWDLPGAVLSGPIHIWPGLRHDPESMALDLQGSGYARVNKAVQPGDFQVGSDSVLVMRRPESGPGWEVPAGQLLVTFKGGKVASVTPESPAILPPTQLAGVRGAENEARTPRALQDFPEHLRHAVLAMEDARFYEHPGISVVGIARALLTNVISGKTRAGGSTLTQQLAKNLFLSQERTLSRKANELLLAFALEKELSKDEILALYLNEIYWGQSGGVAICGADQAARAYFGKPVDRLSLGESATLAGIISSPNSYSPLRHPEVAQQRRDIALQRMADEFWLDQSQVDQEQALPLQVIPGVQGRRAPYAVDTLVDEVEATLGQGTIAAQGLTVHSTIHPPLQRLAEDVLAESMAKLEAAYPQATGVQAALVAVRVSDGAILAMVGGRDYGSSQFNRATLAQRQVGSTVKPLTLLAAFEQDRELNTGTLFLDEPISRRVDGKTWRPQNYDGVFVGDIPLRDAIAKSRNIPAVLLAELVGFGPLQKHLQALGLSGATSLPSVSLGGFEATPTQLAGAYTVFPGKGVYAPPHLLRAAADQDGKVLLDREPTPTRQASARAAMMATSVLQSVIQKGTGSRASQFGAKGSIAGKSGTTDGYRDAWFVGFSPTVTVAVWVGFDANGSAGLGGSKAALPTWSRFLAGSGTTSGSFPTSRDVVEQDTCVSQEWLLQECSDCRPELYSRGTAPRTGCNEPINALDIGALLDRTRREVQEQEQEPKPGKPKPMPAAERTWPWKWKR